MNPSIAIRFGPVRARIEATRNLSDVLAALERWLIVEGPSDAADADLLFTLSEDGESRPASDDRRFAGSGWVEDGRFGWWDGRGWDADIFRDQASGRLLYACRVREATVLAIARRVPAMLLRMAHHHYFGHAEMLASAFLYGHLLPAVEVALLAKRATFVHASSVLHASGAGVVICGWGGSGKTSASSFLYMRRPAEWRFLSDDLAVVSEDGLVHPSPAPVNVFPYNTDRFPELTDAIMSAQGAAERFQWKVRARLFGHGGVVRRMAPVAATRGDTAGRIEMVFNVQRSAASAERVTACPPEQLARSAAGVLGYELRRGLTGFSLANAFCGTPAVLPAPEHVIARAESLLNRAFARASIWNVDIPQPWEPDRVGRLIERLANQRVRV